MRETQITLQINSAFNINGSGISAHTIKCNICKTVADIVFYELTEDFYKYIERFIKDHEHKRLILEPENPIAYFKNKEFAEKYQVKCLVCKQIMTVDYFGGAEEIIGFSCNCGNRISIKPKIKNIWNDNLALANKNAIQGKINDFVGDEYQFLVLKYLEARTGQKGVSSGTHDPDVIVANYTVEVKGITDIVEEVPYRSSTRYRGYKMFLPSLKYNLTHFCYVLVDPDINSRVSLYFVDIEVMMGYFFQKFQLNRSDWVHIPFKWVKRNFNREISYIH
jgi:hypothetical protein